MSFEEFFLKKKIDLKAIESNNNELFKQLEFEFQELGPKSFDHQKKYLFNKWRYQYPLDNA